MIGALLSNPVAAATVEAAPVASSFIQDLRYAFYSSGWSKFFGVDLTSVTSQGRGDSARRNLRPADTKAETSDERESRVAQVKIYPGDVEVFVGEQLIFIAVGEDAEGNTLGGFKVKWGGVDEGSNKNINISPYGEFSALRTGKYIISAEIAGHRAQVKVTVKGESYPSKSENKKEIKINSRELRRKHQSSNMAPVSGDSRRLMAGKKTTDKVFRASSTALVRTPRMLYLPNGEDPEGWNSENIGSFNEVGAERGTVPGRDYNAGTGSGNFQIAAPAVSLGGRGIDVNLSFNYNSRIWHRSSTGMIFDIDRDWLSGWNLGFGKIVMAGNNYMLIDADGTRHEFSGTTTYDGYYQTFKGRTTDGTFIDYSAFGYHPAYAPRPERAIFSGSVRLSNGTTITYGASGSYAVHPTKITDAHGNFIKITYRDNITKEYNTGPYIETIEDTLGRIIRFHYATGTNLLTAITVPGLQGGIERQVVRLNYRSITLSDAGTDYGFQAWLTPTVRQNTIPVISAIYYPGTNTGYWFGDADSYSRYGMIRKVSERRGMTFNNTALNDQGSIGAGSISRELVYENPLTPGYSDIYGLLSNTPLYTKMTENWAGLQTSSQAVTKYTVEKEGSVRKTIVTRPDDVSFVSFSNNDEESAHYGLMTENITYSLSGAQLHRTQTKLIAGQYDSSRPEYIYVWDEKGQMTYTYFGYGDRFDAPTEIREVGYSGQILKKTVIEYLNDDNYNGVSTSYGGRSGGMHIFNLPRVVDVYSGDNARESRTEYEYDGKSLIDASNVQNHDVTFNPYISEQCYMVDNPKDPDCQEICPDPSSINSSADSTLQSPVCDGVCSQIRKCDPGYKAETKYRGDVTKTTTYVDSTSLDLATAIIANFTYDITGNVRTQSTACCEQTTFNYTSNTAYAWPESMTRGSVSDPASQNTSSAIYDFNTGLVKGSYDPNGRYSNTIYNATSLRPEFVYSPTGAYAYYVYNDAEMYIKVHAYESGKSAGEYTSRTESYFDGKGRVYKNLAFAVDNSIVVTDEALVVYDNLGRTQKQSSPFRTGTNANSIKWTQYEYDVMNRPVKVTSPDGSVVESFYNETTAPSSASSNLGQTVRSRDAWGRERWGRFDEQSRLVEVVEPNPSGNGSVLTGGMVTSFEYDTQSNLITVNQGSQTRRFKYDSLGRVTHQKLAERDATLDDDGNLTSSGSWSDVFGYDNRSNLISKKDARGVITELNYNNDPLNRLQNIKYRRDQVPAHLSGNIPDAPNVGYVYATSGDRMRLTNMQVAGGLGSQDIFYDVESRVSEVRQASRGGVQLSTNYLYDTLDRIKEVRYPQQIGAGDARKVISHNYDLASRLTELKYDNTTMASNPVFNASDQITSLAIGNQITEKYDFDPTTGLLTGQQVNKGTEKLLDLKYNYTQNNDASNNGAKTGQLTSVTDLKNAARNRAYNYDTLGRLYQVKGGASAASATPEWNQIYHYDRYGNKTGQTKTGGDPVQSNPIETTWFDDALPAGAVANNDNTQAQVTASFKNVNGYYFTAMNGGGWEVNSYRKTNGPDEKFKLIDVNGGTLESGDSVQLLASNGRHYISAQDGGAGRWTELPAGQVFANKTQPGAWETFVIRKADGSSGAIGTNIQVSLQSSGGYYFWTDEWYQDEPIHTSPLGQLYANSITVGEWETFTLEVVSVNGSNAPAAVGFKSSGGFYINPEKGTGWEVSVDETSLNEWTTFGLEDLNSGQLVSGDRIRLRKDEGVWGGGYYLSIFGGGAAKGTPPPTGRAYVNTTTPSNNETFIIRKVDGSTGAIGNTDRISLQTENGYYFCAEGGGATWSAIPPLGQLFANSNSVEGDREKYTIELTTSGGGGNDESWNWTTSNPAPQSGTKVHQSSIASDIRQHYFYGATDRQQIGAGDKLFTWVYLDPANMPEEIMLQWWDPEETWGHRAYWGANKIGWGTDGTNSRRYMGPLPAGGGWLKLEVPASAVGLEGKWTDAMAFTQYGGRVTWDKSGKISQGAPVGLGIPIDGLANQNVNPISYNSTNNRITSPGFEYDPAGNQTSARINESGTIQRYKYDTANRLREVLDVNGNVVAGYLYGTSNERLSSTEGGLTTYYVRAGGQALSEYEAVGASGLQWKMSYMYLGGRLLATEQSNGIRYHHPDRLGTRLVTDSTDGAVLSESLHLPFGTAQPMGPNLGGDNSWQHPTRSNLSKKKFTSYDRSDSTGLDYAVNRQYSSPQGRFTQVDPIGMASVSLGDPQTLNLYAYCANDPVNFADPLGLNKAPPQEDYQTGRSSCGDMTYYMHGMEIDCRTAMQAVGSGSASIVPPGGFTYEVRQWTSADGWMIFEVSEKTFEGMMKVWKENYRVDGNKVFYPDGELSATFTRLGELPDLAKAVFFNEGGLVDQMKRAKPVVETMAVVGATVATLPLGLGGKGTQLVIGEIKTIAPEFFAGAKYSIKVLGQMDNLKDIGHAFPKSVDGFAAKFGRWATEFGRDGRLYERLEIKGSYGGKTGVFEYIKDGAGAINHRFFKF